MEIKLNYIVQFITSFKPISIFVYIKTIILLKLILGLKQKIVFNKTEFAILKI